MAHDSYNTPACPLMCSIARSATLADGIIALRRVERRAEALDQPNRGRVPRDPKASGRSRPRNQSCAPLGSRDHLSMRLIPTRQISPRATIRPLRCCGSPRGRTCTCAARAMGDCWSVAKTTTATSRRAGIAWSIARRSPCSARWPGCCLTSRRDRRLPGQARSPKPATGHRCSVATRSTGHACCSRGPAVVTASPTACSVPACCAHKSNAAPIH
jgi:hypothetical protein